ncbi:MAG: LamG domain-containing protein [Chitinophagaceae bacterium]|nr:LamG domain-containing protein [Chitinophagaceae bacterium]
MKNLLLPLLLFISFHLCAQQSIPVYIPTNGLVGWWPFTGNANDSSGNGNHGTVSSAVLATDRFGNLNAAYSFNGVNSKINVTDAPSLRCRKITLSAWVKCLDTTSINQIIYKGSMTAAGEAYSFSLNTPNGHFAGGIKYGSNCVPAVGWYAGAQTAQPAPSSVWVHIMYTYDGASAKFYKNGSLEDSTDAPGLIDSCTGGDLRFGFNHLRYFASTGDPFNGSIDDIGIWNRALSSTEVTQLYTSSLTDCGYGNLGINVCSPQRNLHVKDVLRLEPRSTPPANPGKGDIYFDDTINKLRVYDGTMWQNCW